MSEKLKKFVQLTMDEKLLFLTSIILLPIISLLLSCIGFIKTKRLLGLLSINHTCPYNFQDNKKKIYTTSRIVRTASDNGLYKARCLEQSILVWWLLAIQNIESIIRIGTSKSRENGFSAHSWVEYHGVNITDSRFVQDQYVLLD